jgi:hypothetical protein
VVTEQMTEQQLTLWPLHNTVSRQPGTLVRELSTMSGPPYLC